jgi:tripartite-type tricarboxylate transporter receptor subunit TctC
MRYVISARHLIVAIAASAVLATPVSAADFYQGKTLTVIVGYAPGGGVDASARAMTRHLGRFIPGQPNIVVQNMEGAAGIVSVNYLERRVAPDGLMLAIPGRSWYIDREAPGYSFRPDEIHLYRQSRNGRGNRLAA